MSRFFTNVQIEPATRGDRLPALVEQRLVDEGFAITDGAGYARSLRTD